jgi:HEPN domain-containing protein
MDEAKIKEVTQWLLKAKHDLGSAELLSSGDEFYLDTAVYHCQQAAEKSLKAYLTLKDTPFQKIHDLSVLIDQCGVLDTAFLQISNVSEILTPYATTFRYPGDVLEPEFHEVIEAINLAKMVLDFVTVRLPPEVIEN